MLRLAHTRLSHGANFREGWKRCPDLALLMRRVCVSCETSSRDPPATARTAMPATPWPATWTHRSASRPQIAARLQLRSICI